MTSEHRCKCGAMLVDVIVDTHAATPLNGATVAVRRGCQTCESDLRLVDTVRQLFAPKGER